MTERSRHLIRWGQFEFDPAAGELRKRGWVIPLQEQPSAVLRLLIDRAGEVVTREELRTAIWPEGTFVDFDNGLNVAVRKIRDALGDSASSPRFLETVPRRGYRFLGPVIVDEPAPAHDWAVSATAPVLDSNLKQRVPSEAIAIDAHGSRSDQRWGRPGRWAAAAIGAAATVAVFAMIAGRVPPAPADTAVAAPTKILPLTTLPGTEFAPVLSPDGKSVAFMWNENKDGRFAIYVGTVGSPEIRRISTPGVDAHWPAWSPDGRHVAYLHRRPDESLRIYVSSLVDGSDQLVSDFPAVKGGLDWSPDGRALVALRAPDPTDAHARPRRPIDEWDNTGIYLVPLRGGEPRQLTWPTLPAQDGDPHFSPDGTTLAFASCTGACDVYVIRLGPAFEPVGRPRKVTSQTGPISKLAWSRDGKWIIYDTNIAPGLTTLWKVAMDGTRPPAQVEFAGYIAHAPATARSMDRLTFVRELDDVDIYRLHPGHEATQWFASSLFDDSPQFSPDGRHVAFASERSGDGEEIWVAEADGSAAHELTHGPGRWQSSPSWSPDGRRVAFDSRGADGSWHIWVVDADGGPVRQVTHEPGDQNVPVWSADGLHLYYTADRGAGRNVWRIPVSGGPREQITETGSGATVRVTADGRGLLYQASDTESPLLTRTLAGGSARTLIACVEPGGFTSAPNALYFVACPDKVVGDPAVHLTESRSGKDRLLGVVKSWVSRPNGLAVSPDGRVILYARSVHDGSDLMLIENFR